VRIFAVRTAAEKGSRGSLKVVESVVLGKGIDDLDLTERQAFFDAYAKIAGQAALGALAEIAGAKGGLFKKSFPPETRACAVMALAKIKSPDARGAVEKLTQDKEVVVRNAAARALREPGV
jgi:HEAT repeat protein